MRATLDAYGIRVAAHIFLVQSIHKENGKSTAYWRVCTENVTRWSAEVGIIEADTPQKRRTKNG